MVYDKIDGTDTRASTGGAGAKPLLVSANTFRGGGGVCRGQAPARVSEHCSVPG